MRVDRADGLLALGCALGALAEGVVLDPSSPVELAVAIAMSLGLALRRTAPALALLPSVAGIPLLASAALSRCSSACSGSWASSTRPAPIWSAAAR